MNRFKFSLGIGALCLTLGVLTLAQTSQQEPFVKHERMDDGEFFVNLRDRLIKHDTPRAQDMEDEDSNPRIGPNIRVNDEQHPYPNGLLGRSEATIAASQDGQHIIVGWNDVEGFMRPPFNALLLGPPGLNGFGFSSDGGATWTDGGAPPVINHALTAGDPWAEQGGSDRNTFYFATLAADDRLPPVKVPLGINIHRGHFHETFNWDDGQLIQAPDYPNDNYDKPVLAAAKNGSGDVYLSLTNFRGMCGRPGIGRGQIEVWRSHDSGDNWQGPVIVSPDLTSITDPDNPACGSEGIFQHWATPVIGPRGELYVVWQMGPTFSRDGITTDSQVMFARSDDGGATFSKPISIADINSMLQNPPVGYDRAHMNDVPHIAVAQRGRHRGRVYVLFYSAVSPVSLPSSEQSLVSSQVFLSYSEDQGRTWSTPTPVAPEVQPTGVKRFWSTVSVALNGNVNVIYYESQEAQATNDANDIECDVLLNGGPEKRTGQVSSLVNVISVESHDGGVTFETPVKLSSTTTNWCTTNSNIFPAFGDYISSVSAGNRVLSAWTDGRNGIPDIFFGSAQVAGSNR